MATQSTDEDNNETPLEDWHPVGSGMLGADK